MAVARLVPTRLAWVFIVAAGLFVGFSCTGAAWVGLEWKIGSRWRCASLGVERGRVHADWYSDYCGCFWTPPNGPVRFDAGCSLPEGIRVSVWPLIDAGSGGGTSGPFQECSVATILLLPVAWVGSIFVIRRGRKRGGGVCAGCGYETAGLKGNVCPECGRRLPAEAPISV